MSLPVVLTAEAIAEFDSGHDYYEAQRPGLGERFSDAVEVVFARIGSNPRLHQFVRDDVRRARIAVFPYCVYYRELPTEVRVISVFHTSRDPAIWQGRV